MRIDDDITAISGVGSQRARLLKTYSINCVGDLLNYMPRDYMDRSNTTDICELMPGGISNVRGIIAEPCENTAANGKILSRLKIRDSSGELDVIWFNQPYIRHNFKKGQEYIFSGKVTGSHNRLQMQSPEYEPVKDGELLNSGRIVPVYPAMQGLSQKQLRSFIKHVLDSVTSVSDDYLSERLRTAYGLPDKAFAIRNIHFPDSDENFLLARKRLVFDELFLMQLTLLKIKDMNKTQKGIVFEDTDDFAITGVLPFALTGAQKRVIGEIKDDIRSGQTMNRLIQGDVGSGKTAVAMIAAYIAIQNGYQAVLMAPTDVLATQHYASFSRYFDMLGINTVLLKGSLNAKSKLAALDSIKNGKAGMVIGTHAVIQDRVEFYNAGLVITDEQHRFGVAQRLTLSLKGACPHVAVMSATPIPRTLALILYGDMDISVLDELPPGRMAIDTFHVNSSYRKRIYTFIEKQVQEGRQAYIICPMIEENEKLQAASVIKYANEAGMELHGCTVRALHGKMKPEEKQLIMDDFAAGSIDVLVSTTVIEVGINVPNATVMVVENAERFGLAQLHQLRGRVGRGAEKSYCVLITDSKTQITVERMKAMRTMSDGFMISETDLRLRGSGDFFGTRQHGLPELRMANLYKDMEILKTAQAAAAFVKGGGLSGDETEEVFKEAERFYSRAGSDVPL